MSEEMILFTARGRSADAIRLASGLSTCVVALESAAAGYEDFRAWCLLAGKTPPRKAELDAMLAISARFAAWMLTGATLTITSPGIAEMSRLLAEALFTPEEAEKLSAVLGDRFRNPGPGAI